jgi:hypothetical protein
MINSKKRNEVFLLIFQSGFDERLDSLRADVIVVIDDVECRNKLI